MVFSFVFSFVILFMGEGLMIFINATESIGQIITNGTLGVTGNIVATMLVIFMILVVIGMMFQIPLEFIVVFMLPFCIAIAAFYTNFMILIVLILIFVSMIIAKNWLFK